MGNPSLESVDGHRRSAARLWAQAKMDWFAGLSRHGSLAAERLTKKPETRTGARQGMSQFTGSLLIGLGVSLYVHANLGVAAYDVMLTALRDILNISLGQASWVFTGSLFGIATLLGHRPKVSGLFYLLGNGLAVDFWVNLLNTPDDMFTRLLFVLVGTGAIAGGVAMVVHAGLTGGPIDALMRAGRDRGLDPFKLRSVIELAIVVLGVLLGGDFGPATIFFIVTMGPLLRVGRQALCDHRTGRQARMGIA